METTLKQHRIIAEVGSKFTLSGQSLTRITLSHLLASTVAVDLSCNNITCVSPLSNLVACRVLNLSNNQIQDIAPLARLTSLETLLLVSNKIESLKQVQVLRELPFLVKLDLRYNLVCDKENIEKNIRNVLENLQSLRLS